MNRTIFNGATLLIALCAGCGQSPSMSDAGDASRDAAPAPQATVSNVCVRCLNGSAACNSSASQTTMAVTDCAITVTRADGGASSASGRCTIAAERNDGGASSNALTIAINGALDADGALQIRGMGDARLTIVAPAPVGSVSVPRMNECASMIAQLSVAGSSGSMSFRFEECAINEDLAVEGSSVLAGSCSSGGIANVRVTDIPVSR